MRALISVINLSRLVRSDGRVLGLGMKGEDAFGGIIIVDIWIFNSILKLQVIHNQCCISILSS